METDIQILLPDERINEVWGNANFGPCDQRRFIRDALLKSVCNYHNGSTINSILLEFGFLKWRKVRNGRMLEVTKEGKHYLFWAIDSERKIL